ncbi:MAG: LPP leucine zipper domain-containing protein [Colwellia sp.]
MLKKITAISLALTITACANTDAINEIDGNITALTNKVEALSTQVSNLEAQQKSAAVDLREAQEAAAAANERIDNVVASYKK